MSKRILLLGATSTIMRHIAIQLVTSEDIVCLAARNQEELVRIAADLKIRANLKTIYIEAGIAGEK